LRFFLWICANCSQLDNRQFGKIVPVQQVFVWVHAVIIQRTCGRLWSCVHTTYTRQRSRNTRVYNTDSFFQLNSIRFWYSYSSSAIIYNDKVIIQGSAVTQTRFLCFSDQTWIYLLLLYCSTLYSRVVEKVPCTCLSRQWPGKFTLSSSSSFHKIIRSRILH
jgi:hypothetical protein